jgi:hypothetical protein
MAHRRKKILPNDVDNKKNEKNRTVFFSLLLLLPSLLANA